MPINSSHRSAVHLPEHKKRETHRIGEPWPGTIPAWTRQMPRPYSIRCVWYFPVFFLRGITDACCTPRDRCSCRCGHNRQCVVHTPPFSLRDQSTSGQIIPGSGCCGVEAAVHWCPCCFLRAKVQRRLVASAAASSRKQTCPLLLHLSADRYTTSGGV